jgi:DNA-binding MarR family transcriptional regulator
MPARGDVKRLPTLRVLRYLSGGEFYSVPELIADLWMSSPNSIRQAVKRLLADGQIEEGGTSSTNARCYGITPTGRQHLKENS